MRNRSASKRSANWGIRAPHFRHSNPRSGGLSVYCATSARLYGMSSFIRFYMLSAWHLPCTKCPRGWVFKERVSYPGGTDCVARERSLYLWGRIDWRGSRKSVFGGRVPGQATRTALVRSTESPFTPWAADKKPTPDYRQTVNC
jgi:hypothetical protein